MEACGEGRTTRGSPGTASPNWNARASITMVRPTATDAASTPEFHFLLRRRRGTEPIAHFEIRDGLPGNRERGAHHAGQPITKNMRWCLERPKRSSTIDEMMMVSIVMPETGLRRVVAMALAATLVKKKETPPPAPRRSGSPRARRTACRAARRRRRLTITPTRTVITGRSRSVRSPEAVSPARKVRAATRTSRPQCGWI